MQVFHQLDYHNSKTISREDFDTLCEVLGIHDIDGQRSGAASFYRNSGLEWLASYRPGRPNSPISPLRYDQLSDVKYNKSVILSSYKSPQDVAFNLVITNSRSNGGGVSEKSSSVHCPSVDLHHKSRKGIVSVQQEPPNFLFTFGPRPFWELWPQKKKRRRRLTLDDFKRSILEQWAR